MLLISLASKLYTTITIPPNVVSPFWSNSYEPGLATKRQATIDYISTEYKKVHGSNPSTFSDICEQQAGLVENRRSTEEVLRLYYLSIQLHRHLGISAAGVCQTYILQLQFHRMWGPPFGPTISYLDPHSNCELSSLEDGFRNLMTAN